MGRKGRHGQAPSTHAAPLADGDDGDLELDAEDVAFVQSHRRQLGFLSSTTLEDAPPPSKRRPKRDDVEDAEQEYERVPRVAAAWKAEAAAAMSVDALPTKLADGRWVYKTVDERQQAEERGATAGRRDPVHETAYERGKLAHAQQQRVVDAVQRGAAPAQPPAVLDELQEQEQSVAQKKERIAAACTALLEAPERNVCELKVLHKLASDSNAVVARLASLSAMLVYKDLAPGYRIRPPTEKELEMAVSKEVRATRDYEHAFLKGYQSFLQLLFAAAGGTAGAAPGAVNPTIKRVVSALDARTALRCLCDLLQALPHFNYRSDLLRALVPLLASDDVASAHMVTQAISSVLATDTVGEASLEAVQLIAHLVKCRDCSAPPHTLDALAALKFDDTLAARLTEERDKGKPMTQKQRNRKWIEERRRLRDEAKSAARKADANVKSTGHDAADDDVDERAMRDFDALPDSAARVQLQTATLEAVCEIYFRVLKAAASANGAAGRPLLGVTLAGLARVAHLIDYEVVADILEVLRRLLAEGDLLPQLRARCLLTACDVLGGQGSALAVDTRDFHRHLYRLAEMPPSLNTSVTPVAGAAGADASRLWVRALSAMLLARMQRQVDTERVAAFSKRLAGIALHAETGEAMSSLAVARELLNRHPKLRRLLENEAGAVRSYLSEVKEPESACALSSCLWELALLQRHAHPGVAALAAHVASLPVEDASPPAPYGSLTPEEVSGAYTSMLGGFRPSIPPRSVDAARRRPLRGGKLCSVIKLDDTEDGGSAAEAARLRMLFREAREFSQNSALRAQAAHLAAQLAAFRSRQRHKPHKASKRKAHVTDGRAPDSKRRARE